MRKCTVEGCNIKHFALGFCRKHHIRFKRNGTTDSIYQKSNYNKIDSAKDHRKGRRGSIAVNYINDMKQKATQRGKDWNLTHEQAYALMIGECLYCGYKPEWPKERSGIDRVDNSIHYVPDNCVSCCFDCNTAKGQKTLEEFMSWIETVYNRLIKKDNK